MEAHFSDSKIIQLLVRYRIKAAWITAKKRKDRSMTDNENLCFDAISVEKLLPPRRKWHRFKSKHRRGLDRTMIAYTTLFRATMSLRHEGAEWAHNLETFIRRVQRRALSQRDFTFGPYRIFAQRKDGKQEYRPIVAFNLEDAIINTLTARYLRERLNALFDDASYFFRIRPADQSKCPDHHDAFREVMKLRERCGPRELFVAEADIKSFFDCLDHAIIRRHVKALFATAKEAGRPVSSRSLKIIEALLACYNFRDSVIARSSELLKQRPPGAFKWPEEELRQINPAFTSAPIGIPQGGALSLLLANIVLHQADKALRMSPQREAFTYIRYCDDMLIAAEDQEVCTKAFALYCAELKKLRLPIHDPIQPPLYQGADKRIFWSTKSKSPYRWGPEVDGGAFPWIGFVGYQLRWDGLARIRLSSLKKHMMRLRDLEQRFFRFLHHKANTPSGGRYLEKKAEAITSGLRLALNTLSVGNPRLDGSSGMTKTFWSNAFNAIWGRNVVWSQITRLDRYRESIFHKACSALGRYAGKKRTRSKALFKDSGYPFSYTARFRTAEDEINTSSPRTRRRRVRHREVG
jgi:hypothetical protein